jgi:hypothetical protein
MPRRKLRGGISADESYDLFHKLAVEFETLPNFAATIENLHYLLDTFKKEMMSRLSPEQEARREEIEYAFGVLSMNSYIHYNPETRKRRASYLPEDVQRIRYALFRVDPPKPARSVSPKATFGGPRQTRFTKGGKKAKRGGANLTPNQLYDEIGKYLLYVVGGGLAAGIGLTLTVPMVQDTVNAIREYLDQLAELRELERQVAEQQVVNNPMRVPGAHV